MKNHRIVVILVLLVYTAIIFIPPIAYGYVYPNNSDDTAFHLGYFDLLKNNSTSSYQYLGQKLVGYPLIWVSNFTKIGIDALFLWFNFFVLWLVGIMAFALVAEYVDWKSGLLAIPMVMFMTPSTLNLFDTGAIYDLMTIGVILPVVLYCAVKIWVTKMWYWFLPLLAAVILMVIVHTMVLWFAFGSDAAENQVPYLSEFVSVFLGYAVVLMFVVVIFWAFPFKTLRMGKETKALLFCLSIIVLVLIVLMFTGFAGWSLRIALDVSIVFPILVICLLGVVLKSSKSSLAWSIVYIFIAVASLPIASAYVHYNSAVKPLDIKAIEYVNNLDGDYYSCSPEVAPWIYGRFIDKEYKEGELPYIIRSKPMTSRTTPNTLAYWGESDSGGYRWHGSNITNFGDGVLFKSGELEITVIAHK